MHVEPDQSNVSHLHRALSDGKSFVEWDSKLHSLHACARVWMWRVDHAFRIDSERHGRGNAHFACDRIEQLELVFRFDVDQEHADVQRFLELASRLAHTAEHDVLPLESDRLGSIELAAGDNVSAGAKSTQNSQYGEIRIRFDAVVKPMRNAFQSRRQSLVLRSNCRCAVNVSRRADIICDLFEGDSVGDERRALSEKTRFRWRVDCRLCSSRSGFRGQLQYAFAQSASAVAGRPHLRQRSGASADRNSSSGSTRIVAFVSSLISASHCALPQNPA